MNCEWAEGYLSAYLDSTLDPPLRAQVSAHLDTCARCRDLLAEYRRYDELLARAQRIAPPEALRERIFSSPEYVAIVRDAARRERRSQPAHTSLGPRWRTPAAPTASQAAFAASSATAAPTPFSDYRASASAPARTPTAHRSPNSAQKVRAWSRLWLPVAAMVVIALGLALLFRQGIGPHSSRASIGKISTPLAGPNFTNTPLAAGNRLVFAHDGALWSVAEAGPTGAPGAEARLTPPGVSVVAWSVSPIVNDRGGSQIAYIDGATGTLHLVRSDRQADHTFATVVSAPAGQTLSAAFWGSATGQAIRAGLSWAPNGAHLAYMSAHGASVTVHVLDVTTGAIPQKQTDHTLSSGVVTAFAWSAQSDWLAYAQASPTQGRPGVWLYSVAVGQARQLTAQADPLATGAYTVTRLTITPGKTGQAATGVTWATGVGNAITGVFIQQFTAASPLRLTPAATHFAAADVSVDGRWLLGDGSTLVSVTAPTDAALTPTLAPVTTLAAPIIRIIWSPTGAVAAIQTQTALSLWTPSGVLSTAPTSSGTTPVWSADGGMLAYQAGDAISAEHLTPERVIVLAAMAHVASGQAVSLQWAPDARALGIASSAGVNVATITATNSRVDQHAATNDALAWSIAG